MDGNIASDPADQRDSAVLSCPGIVEGRGVKWSEGSGVPGEAR